MEGAVAIDAGEGGRGLAETDTVAQNFIVVVDSGAGDTNLFGDERDDIVVANGFVVFAFGAGDDKESTRSFHIAVGVAVLAQKFGSAHLEVFEVFGVVEITHRVAFGISDADLNFT